ncbi:MFS transporter [Pseudoduganella ginsengisoli]|uniref:MFS transporter n=1 Tax=Pseudoduganella ginsengisoli TaxID=1462440 RepID=A0A6L6Q7E9_9BURK|nr:MFS transporter [Pseudoduganella ginsengisoli]MTW05515.1 MFS transporter [Pseudoduganella ginsengisoli]
MTQRSANNAAPAAPDALPDGLPPRQRLFAFVAVAIAVTMAVLDTAIVNVALPSMSRDLGSTPAQAVWIVNAYQLAITIALLPLASVGDSLGYKKVYWCGLALFSTASCACAYAPTLPVLACARAVQGLGAAGIMSVNIALVRYIFPKAQLGVGMGYSSLVVAVSSAAGPSVAAAILSLANWQWLFLVNVPLGALALVVAARALPKTPASRHPFDVAGAALNALTFGLLIGGLNTLSEVQGGRQAAAMLVLALLFGVVFVRRELRRPVPMLPVDLLRMPVFALSLVTSIGSFAAQTMAGIALPFYFEHTLGQTAVATGLLMTPWPVMTALVAPMAGRLSDRFPPARLACVGLLVMALGLASLPMLGAAPSYVDLGWRLGLCGVGFGLFQSPNNRVIVGSAPRSRSGGASGLQSMGRLLGQSLGAVAVAVIFALGLAQPTAWIAWAAAALALMACGASSLRPAALK